MKLTEQTARLPGFTVTVSTREALLAKELMSEEQDILCVSADESVAFYIFNNRIESKLSDLVESTQELLAEQFPDIVEIARNQLTVNEYPATEVVFTEAGSTAVAVRSIQFSLAPDLHLEIRLVYYGDPDGFEELRRSFVNSIRIEKRENALSFLEGIESDGKQEEPTHSDSTSALLNASQRICELEQAPLRFTVDKEGGWILAFPYGVSELSPMLLLSEIYSGDNWDTNRSAARTKFGLFMGGMTEPARKLNDGTPEEQDFVARLLVPAPKGLLVARSASAPTFPGIELTSVGNDELVLRGQRTEKALKTFRGQTVAAICLDSSEKRVLCALHVRKNYGWNEPRDLQIVDLKSKEVRPVGSWPAVRAFGRASEGWLISGRPEGRVDGIYHVLFDEAEPKLKLLVSGSEAMGMDWSDEGLLFFQGGDNGGGAIYVAKPAAVREHGPASAPFFAELINEIATAAAPPEGALSILRSQAAMEVFLKSADAESVRRVGSPLPKSTSDVDRLLSDLSWNYDVSPDGLVLLAALFSHSICEAGGTWVDAGDDPLEFIGATSAPDDNEFLVTYRPLAVVIETLYDEDGWWNPCNSIVEGAQGRKILLGEDPAQLHERFLQSTTNDWQSELPTKTLSGIRSFLTSHPGNRHLRNDVYAQLAAMERREELAQLAESFSQSDEATETDLHYWLGSIAGADATLEERELIAAIQRFPQSAAMFFLLGNLYGRSGRTEEAIAAYERTAELEQWGFLANSANEALAELEE